MDPCYFEFDSFLSGGFLRGYNVHLPLMSASISKTVYVCVYYKNVP